MDFNLIKTWINENEIDNIVGLALKMDKTEYNILIKKLIEILESTSDNMQLNTVANILGDLDCNEAIEPLICLINTSELANCRGNLIS